jgi:DNA-binding NarL/FixJ family response regulator
MTRILIADDHPLFRDGLRRLLESERDFVVCGEAVNGNETANKVRQLRPDLLLLDLSMPGSGGLEALRELADEDIRTRTLLLTAAIEQEELVAALQLGARGLVMKDSPGGLLLKAIRGVLAGEFWVGRERVANIVHALQPRRSSLTPQSGFDQRLTDRELLVISGVVTAAGNREIADNLGISEKTVKRHLTNIFDKLGVSTRVELAMFAVRHGLPLPEFKRTET